MKLKFFGNILCVKVFQVMYPEFSLKKYVQYFKEQEKRQNPVN
jgi:hypothetical protein